MSVKIIESGNPKLLEPLTCCRSIFAIPIAGETLENILVKRWQNVSPINAIVDFWPSHDLIEKLQNQTTSFSVFCGEKEVAWTTKTTKWENKKILADEKSFMIIYPWHILAINEDLLAKIETKIDGEIRENVNIDGNLILGENSIILPGVYIEGNVMIGKNCKIGPNCYIRGSTFIDDKCHIGQAVEVKNSLIMNNVAAGHLSYIGDSIVCPKTNFGAGTIISNFRHDGKNHKSMINNELIDTGRRKFGAIIGDNVHTGIHTSIYSGRKLWANTSTRPGEIVQKDILN